MILTVVVLRKMEILCAVLFALFSLSLFLGISEGFFSHVCLPDSTLQCGITPLIICFGFKIKNYFNYYSFISLKYQSCFFKYTENTLKPKLSFYFSSALSEVLKHIIT